MTEKKIKWTEQQRRAITARGKDVLVTASAGTGKTAVLSGRCVDIVSDKTTCPDVFELLVLTFTEAAAEQMRSRIAEQLTSAFTESNEPRLRSHLHSQLILLGGADISTIHSFCKRLITEHFYKLGLDPTLSVIDSDEAKLLKAEILEKTIDWAWQQSNLAQPLAVLLGRRDLRTNNGFLAKIIEVSNFLDGITFRQNWYERAAMLAEAANPFTSEPGEEQKRIVAEKLNHILDQLRHAQKLYSSCVVRDAYCAKENTQYPIPNTHDTIRECIEFLEAGNWDSCAEKIRNFDKPRVNKPKELPEPIAELIRKTVKKAVDAFVQLSNLAVLNPDYLDKVSGSAGLQTKVVIELVKKFDRLYSRAKRTINCLDFADLEHYALKLLTEQGSSDDTLSPSETARALRRKYKYIFVDEYQDINPVQQAILDALSPGGNVFVVGDVKQSIYAFRGADPKIFIKELKSASVDPENAPDGLRVDLNTNFRSAKGILDFVNKVFARIMTASFTGIDYDKSAKLKPAQKNVEFGIEDSETSHKVELHILDEENLESGIDNSESKTNHESRATSHVISSRQRQAAMIARRIRQMVGAETGKCEFQILDKQQGCFRDVEYRDIVILMRSPAKRANDYVEVLQSAGVPVSCEAAAGYFETTEITDIVCLLKVLDNPQRDIELAGVLRSPLFKVSDTELAKIKIHGKLSSPVARRSSLEPRATGHESRFYDCLLQYCANGPDAKLADRLKEILAVIEQWRTLARRGNIADLIWQIYRETSFLSFVSALPNGRGRRANLLKLHDRAIQFEGFAGSGGMAQLSRFVEFIEKLQEAGQDWAEASPEDAAENAVRIISVHKSKGLEFPVVFLAELSSQFNKKDSQGDFLVDAADTLGLQIIDHQANSRLSSLAHQVIAERKLSTSLAEEMRILYVATTRAMDRLILTASAKRNHCRSIISNGFFFGNEAIPDWQLCFCQSPLDWVLYGLSDRKSLHNAFETGLAEKCVNDDLFSIKLYGQAELQQLSGYIVKLKGNKLRRSRPTVAGSQPKRAEPKLLLQVKKSLNWRYQFGDVALLPAKQSVTQLTHRNDEYLRIDYSGALARKPKAVLPVDLAGAVDGRLIGIATHLVIARLDLTGPVTCEAIERTKDTLLVDGAITEAVAERIDINSIITFFESELGQTALNANNTVRREWPFTFAVPASSVARAPSLVARVTNDDTIIVQGIIDMLVQTPKGLMVIDFKTDSITAEEVCRRAELYREQLELYSRATAAILKTEVAGRWLYFLTPNIAYSV